MILAWAKKEGKKSMLFFWWGTGARFRSISVFRPPFPPNPINDFTIDIHCGRLSLPLNSRIHLFCILCNNCNNISAGQLAHPNQPFWVLCGCYRPQTPTTYSFSILLVGLYLVTELMTSLPPMVGFRMVV